MQHAHCPAQIGFAADKQSRRHLAHYDLDLHRAANQLCAHPVGNEPAAGERCEKNAEQTRIGHRPHVIADRPGRRINRTQRHDGIIRNRTREAGAKTEDRPIIDRNARSTQPGRSTFNTGSWSADGYLPADVRPRLGLLGSDRLLGASATWWDALSSSSSWVVEHTQRASA